MSPTILVAAAAALAILLIAAGIATSGRGSAVTERLERYASGRQEAPKPESTGQGPISDLIAQSSAVAALNRVVEQRDFGANISRELAQADGGERGQLGRLEDDGVSGRQRRAHLPAGEHQGEVPGRDRAHPYP